MHTSIIFVVMLMTTINVYGGPLEREELKEELQLRILEKLLEEGFQEERNTENQAKLSGVEDDTEKRELDARIQELEQDVANLNEKFEVVARSYDDISSKLEERKLDLEEALKQKQDVRDYPKKDVSPLEKLDENLKKMLAENEDVKRFLDAYEK